MQWHAHPAHASANLHTTDPKGTDMQHATRTPNGTATDWHNALLDALHAQPAQPAPTPKRQGPHGSEAYPLVQQIADGIAVHGLRWAVRHYAKRLPQWQARVLLRSAYGA